MADEKLTNVGHLKQVMQAVDDDFIDNEEFEAALTEAQESGEFDGVGIASIEQTTTSNADGGTNVITITMTNGVKKIFSVKNGSKGSTGGTGATGAAGVGVKSVEQTTTSNADGGTNVITVTLTDGTKATFNVKNGSKGSTGNTGPTGATGVGVQSIEQTTTATADGGNNVVTITLTDGTKKTFNVKNGSKGSTGAAGVSITKVEQTTTSSADGGTNVITVTLSNGETATFNVKNGSKGSTGTRGSQIYSGTAITGTSTTATVFSSSGISSALVNDIYINTSTWNYYQCTVAGGASAAKWVYKGCMKGATGSTGATGGTGPTGPQGVSVTKVEQTTTSTADGGTNVITVTLSDGQKFTFNVKNGSKGSNGSNGSNGAAATIEVGTVTTGAAGSNAAVTNAGTSAAAKLNFTIPRGATGATGTRGSQIYWGTAITGTSTTAAVFSGSGISSALVNDLYLNTSNWNVYQCTTAGAASAAKWKYVGNIKGATGPAGSNATVTVDSALSSSSTNPVQNKVINTALSGKAASSHNQAASTITAGTFAGQVVAKAGSQAAGTSLLRNTKLVASETTPTNEGEIFWTYG